MCGVRVCRHIIRHTHTRTCTHARAPDRNVMPAQNHRTIEQARRAGADERTQVYLLFKFMLHCAAAAATVRACMELACPLEITHTHTRTHSKPYNMQMRKERLRCELKQRFEERLCAACRSSSQRKHNEAITYYNTIGAKKTTLAKPRAGRRAAIIISMLRRRRARSGIIIFHIIIVNSVDFARHLCAGVLNLDAPTHHPRHCRRV